MSVVQFITPGAIPLEAFTLMGVNVKMGNNPIGRFGTGLKYAVAVILREGGLIRLFVDGTEYGFFLKKMNFRGTELSQIMMRKRHGLGHWLRPTKLPFTTQLGRDWNLWQAYRELESNTRDEGGRTARSAHQADAGPSQGTVIEVDCRGFSKAVDEEAVFLYEGAAERVFRSPTVDIYDAPSRFLYYMGIRVYELRYPSLFTYNFGKGRVTLTEDRTVANIWSCMYDLAHTIQYSVEDESVLDRILEESERASFENYELNFDSSGSEIFRARAKYLGFSGTLGRAGSRWYQELDAPEEEPTSSVELTDEEWQLVLVVLDENTLCDDVAEKIRDQL